MQNLRVCQPGLLDVRAHDFELKHFGPSEIMRRLVFACRDDFEEARPNSHLREISFDCAIVTPPYDLEIGYLPDVESGMHCKPCRRYFNCTFDRTNQCVNAARIAYRILALEFGLNARVFTNDLLARCEERPDATLRHRQANTSAHTASAQQAAQRYPMISIAAWRTKEDWQILRSHPVEQMC